MVRIAPALACSFALLLSFGATAATDPDRDFSGNWTLDAPASSNASAVSFQEDRSLTVAQDENTIQCSAPGTGGVPVKWNYKLDRSETQYTVEAESRNSVVKWEGDALLVNTLVTGPRNYALMDRWKLSRDHATLTITRQVARGTNQIEGVLVYRRDGQPASKPVVTEAPAPSPSVSAALRRPAAPAAAAEVVVPAGTRIPLALRTPVSTKHSHEGDRVYLETQFPVTIDGHIVIPAGSYVNGTVTTSKAAGIVKGKGELFLRFDSLTLPNGVTRDFRSRLDQADTPDGKVDRKEGKITGERDKAGAAKTTAEGAGIGTGVGGIAGAAAGRPLAGVGIGAAAGAAAGLASVLIKHRPDATLPAGTTVEMILDRDLRYLPADLKF